MDKNKDFIKLAVQSDGNVVQLVEKETGRPIANVVDIQLEWGEDGSYSVNHVFGPTAKVKLARIETYVPEGVG